ncbi:polysaccharide lyase family 8 super-sandwich domain-containing protein [Arthrobacter sp. GMC3]|uniref:polysaccharide lyase family 8 super-sandwich domain-containing protein n=1 Tax=Arthrobacter sp. GMC3 TaxID=2058894 RepID=UPI000CE36680|nr:polysaccharide lyase family 8 super-sandwich domain-containing protein [Arthrobacter sp. GMC3]
MIAAIQRIRRRRVELLTGGAALDMNRPQERAAIEALDSRVAALLAHGAPNKAAEVAQAAALLEQVKDLAVAWATPSSHYFQHDAVSSLILDRLRGWAQEYGSQSPEVGNWWFWEIGIPHLVTDIGLLLGDALPVDCLAAIDGFVGHFVGDPNVRTKMPELKETGANRADKAAIVIKHGALMGWPERIAAGRDAVVDADGGGEHSLFGYVDEGDGLYRDGSYIQHDKLAYAGAYGLVTLNELADLMFLLGESDWAIDMGQARPFLDSVERCYSPFITDGYMMDCTRGRGVSRSFATDEHMGAAAAGAVARLATLGGPDAQPYKSLVKGWLNRHPGMPMDHLPLNRMGLLHAVANDPDVTPAAALTGHLQTPDQERVVHRRLSWQASFSLSSSRRGRFEWGNGENLHGWYQGDGQVQLFTNTDRGSYSGNYWATSDPLHLPGVTNAVPEEGLRGHRDAPGTGIPAATADWAGGASWADAIGTVGMLAENIDDGVTAVKSWFCLEDSIVCLGAGITGGKGHPVHTTVEARRLQLARARFVLEPAEGETPGWAHLENVGGYLLFDVEGLQAGRHRRTASWREVNVDGSPDAVSDSYQLLHLDHGMDPVGATYGYSVYPAVKLADMPAIAVEPGFEVLANTADVQAVRLPQRGIVMANFFAAGTAGEIAADGSAAVVLGPGQTPNELRISLSDPAQRNLPLTITVQRPAQGLHEAPEGTEFTPGEGCFAMTVPMAGTRGHTQTLTVRLG